MQHRVFYLFPAGIDCSIKKDASAKTLCSGSDELHLAYNPVSKQFKLAHLLEALTVFLRGHNGRQEQLHVADGLLHNHVKHAQQGAPLIQHLPGGWRGEIPGKFTRTHTYKGTQGRQTLVQIDTDTQRHMLVYSTLLNWRSKQHIIRCINHITVDETYSLQLLIKAFKMWSTELQINRKRRHEFVWACVYEFCFNSLGGSKCLCQEWKIFNIHGTYDYHLSISIIDFNINYPPPLALRGQAVRIVNEWISSIYFFIYI